MLPFVGEGVFEDGNVAKSKQRHSSLWESRFHWMTSESYLPALSVCQTGVVPISLSVITDVLCRSSYHGTTHEMLEHTGHADIYSYIPYPLFIFQQARACQFKGRPNGLFKPL